MAVTKLNLSGINELDLSTTATVTTSLSLGVVTVTLPSTGTGSLSLQTSPSLVTPSLGVAKANRIALTQATVLAAGNFSLSAGWGSTAAISLVNGHDQAWSLTVTSGGSGIASSPTLTLTFADGTWTTVPIGMSKHVSGTGAQALTSDALTATTWIVTFNGLPVSGNTYVLSGIAVGV